MARIRGWGDRESGEIGGSLEVLKEIGDLRLEVRLGGKNLTAGSETMLYNLDPFLHSGSGPGELLWGHTEVVGVVRVG